jgi:outer membrane immunogenic protein
MKRLLFTTAAFGALALPAIAADMNPAPAPMYKAPVAVPVYTWNGCYIGGTIGGASAQSTDTWAANPTAFGPGLAAGISSQASRTLTSSGVAGGVEGGCNYQVSPVFVLGVEADWQGTGLSGSRTGSVNVPGFFGTDGFIESFNSHWLSTVRGRAGYAAGPWLFYATAGLAVSNISFADTIAFPGIGVSTNAISGSTTATGWTVGGGVEWMFAPNWTVKAEYLYAQLPGATYTSVNSAFAAATIAHTHGDVQESIGRVGVNYNSGRAFRSGVERKAPVRRGLFHFQRTRLRPDRAPGQDL